MRNAWTTVASEAGSAYKTSPQLAPKLTTMRRLKSLACASRQTSFSRELEAMARPSPIALASHSPPASTTATGISATGRRRAGGEWSGTIGNHSSQ
jgi:hypothetical protein